MKIAFLNTSVSRRNGGVSEVARRLAQELQALEPGSVEVFGLRDDDFAADAAGWQPLQPRVFPATFPRNYGYARELLPALAAGQPELCHVHGLWAYPTLAARRWAQATGRPYVVTVHGMLDAWALRNSGWKKALVGTLLERRNLADAACLHAITPAEIQAIRDYGLSNPVCLIPNGVDLPPEGFQSPPAPWADRLPAGRKVLLYLGRIHPKKGLVPLIGAWELLHRQQYEALSEWSLAIAGWDQGGHEAELRARVQAAHLEAHIHFIGPQFGEAKAAAYHHARAFILPSFSEGLPLVVLEAWAHRKPVLMTEACNLPQGFAAEAALRIEPTAESIAQGLQTLFSRSDSARVAMGNAGRELVRQHFAWQAAAAEFAAGIRSGCARAEKPPRFRLHPDLPHRQKSPSCDNRHPGRARYLVSGGLNEV